MKKLFMHEETGSIFWMENGALQSAPLHRAPGSFLQFDFSEGAEVDESQLDAYALRGVPEAKAALCEAPPADTEEPDVILFENTPADLEKYAQVLGELQAHSVKFRTHRESRTGCFAITIACQ